jgi:hypothetical protein
LAPAGHAHRAIGEGHQHAALHDTTAVVMLGLGHEGIEMRVALLPRPERPDEPYEAFVAISLPAGSRRIEGRNLTVRHLAELTSKKPQVAAGQDQAAALGYLGS